MKKIILASSSTIYKGNYLDYLKPTIETLFRGIKEILFIPFARPGGISYEQYTQLAKDYFKTLNIKVIGITSFSNPQKAIKEAAGFFTGGGNTFLLVKKLHELNLMNTLKKAVENENTPYLGTSAGSNIGGINMKTTNDMTIVYPTSFETMGLVPFNINPHYLDPLPELKHNGETRETRIKEFHTQNNVPVIGLREGSWIKVLGSKITSEGQYPSRIFEKDKLPYELEPGNEIKFNS